MRITAVQATFAAALLTVAVARAAATGGPSPVLFVPDSLDLGEWGAGGSASASVWLINAGDAAVELQRTEVAADGLSLATVTPGPIPPSGAVEFRVTLTAADEVGAVRTRRVTAFFAGHEPVSFATTVRAIHPDVHLPPPDADRHSWSAIRPTPARLDFGPAAPGERVSKPIWLVNTADTPVRCVTAKGGCGCIEFPDFQPFTIRPGRAMELRPTMIGQGDIGTTRFKYASFVFDDLEPVSVEFHMRIVDPRESKVRRFLAAREREDTAAMRVCMTLDSRIWLGRREGAGIAREPDGTAPWNAWDTAMHTQRHYDDFEVDGSAVRVKVTETSDFHRLAGCPPHTETHTYFFNDDREIEGLLITPDAGDATPPGTCVEAFLEWARRHHPRELESLYTDGAISRTAAGAARWRTALIEWRRATGRPDIDLGTSPWE